MELNASVYKASALAILPRIINNEDLNLTIALRLSAIIGIPLLCSYYWVCKYRGVPFDKKEVQHLLDFYAVLDVKEEG